MPVTAPQLAPWLRRGRVGALAAAAIALLLFPVASDDLFYQNLFILTFLLAAMASSWNIISGYTGYVSLGQSAFLGIGAYTTALLALEFPDLTPFLFVPAAGLVAAAIAAIVGLVLMRTRGHSFVILTIAFLFMSQLVILNWSSLTNGSSGITLPLPTWDLDFQNWPFYYFFFFIMLATIALSWWVRRTKFGMGLIAIREDEDKAATVGVNTPIYKVLSFVASAVFIGMAGGVFAYYLTFIDPRGMFDIVISVQIVLAVILGGRGTLWGPVLGAFMIEPLFEFTNTNFGGGNWRLVLSGGLMALVVLFLPRGVIPSLGSWWRARGERGRAALVGARLERQPRARERPPRPAPAPTPTSSNGRSILEVKGLRKSFGGLRAVDDASFTIAAGSINALIGPNGSGKTTLFNLIGGTMSPDTGEVWFEGRRIDRLPPWRRAHLGIGRTFQITRLFQQMTVLENVVAPLHRFSWRQMKGVAVTGSEAERAEELLKFVGMQAFRHHPAQELSFGQQKLVELAQVLMLEPKLILLDEPAGGINPTLVEEIGEMIRELNRQGTTFLIVEHNMPMVLGLCDPVLVLARGTCLCSGTPQEIQQDPRVLDAYLGEDYSAAETLEPT
jgi:branched-chain amino acid transport system permease protein